MPLSLSEIDADSLNLVRYPHPALLAKAAPISVVNDSDTVQVAAIARRMIQIIESPAHPGIGLAANQVGLPISLFVAASNLNVPGKNKLDFQVYINPSISNSFGGMEEDFEGCLSLPNIRGLVSRHAVIQMQYTDLSGGERTVVASGLQGRCLQHEMDHLLGVNIIDKFSDKDRKRSAPAMKKLTASK